MDNLKEKIQTAVNIFKGGNLEKAAEICKNLINENPRLAFLYNLMGLISSQQKKIDQAIKYYEQGLKIDPNFSIIYNNLGLIYFNKSSNENIKKAQDLYKKSISINKNNPEPYTNLGNLYNFENDIEQAIIYHKKAININAKFPYAHFNISNTYVSTGNFNEARKHLKEAIKLKPDFYSAHRLLSRITTYTTNEEHLNALQELHKKTNNDNKIDLSFSLGKAFEDIKDFDKSFNFYKEANALFRKKINFSLEKEKENFNEIKNIYDEKFFIKFEKSGKIDSNPIFIVGMPRSGTTLVEQILSSHSQVFGADEVSFIPDLIAKNFSGHNMKLFFTEDSIVNNKSLEKIGKEYILKMNNLSKNSKRTTDKLPINFLYIGFIKLILPNAKIIHCDRNPKDIILSVFKNHFPGGKIKFAYNLDELVEFYNLYADLMKHWNKVLPNFIYNIKYESIISNIESEVKSLLLFCNLEWEKDCLNFYNNKRTIKTASDSQVRKKIYNSSVDTWKDYNKHLSEYFKKIKF